jgi:hypothetical protein
MIDITVRRSASAVEPHNALVNHVTLRQFVGRQRLSPLCSVRHSLAYLIRFYWLIRKPLRCRPNRGKPIETPAPLLRGMTTITCPSRISLNGPQLSFQLCYTSA